jgi:hypothetical protein
MKISYQHAHDIDFLPVLWSPKKGNVLCGVALSIGGYSAPVRINCDSGSEWLVSQVPELREVIQNHKLQVGGRFAIKYLGKNRPDGRKVVDMYHVIVETPYLPNPNYTDSDVNAYLAEKRS